MRTSLSCDRCRKSKVKCHHDGHAPCQRCAKAGIPDCALSRPDTAASRSNARRSLTMRRSVDPSPVSQNPTPGRSSVNHDGDSSATLSDSSVTQHLAALPLGVIIKCLNAFHNKFPELAILHLPTLSQNLQSGPSIRSEALLAAILAVTKPQLIASKVDWAHVLLDREQYATHAKQLLTDLMFQPPEIYVVQALLIITLHEWGMRDFHKAWVYCGIAIRNMQALYSLRIAPYPLDAGAVQNPDPTLRAIEIRTYWGCFIMDCMVNSGTYNPPMLPMSEMRKLKIPNPPSVVEYAFSSIPAKATDVSLSAQYHPRQEFDVTQGFEILVTGFDIWTKLMTFIFNDGRRAPGMCAPANCPWVEGSPWWTTRQELESWRASQASQLQYPAVPVAVHMVLSYGETFVYLNLLYYVSTLMLHREYFPFLPTVDSVPQGPVDHPMLEATAPEGWWNDSAAELFSAAENISCLLRDAADCGVHLMTPFVGFCAFSAGYLNSYVSCYPRMNLGRSLNGSRDLALCMDYLKDFKNVWTIGDGWLKTIQHAALLYQRASADRGRYHGKTRADFEILHQSVHDFRVVDRSDLHTQELDGADQRRNKRVGYGDLLQDSEMDANGLLNQLMAEISSNLDEQGAWSQWWPPMEDINLPHEAQ